MIYFDNAATTGTIANPASPHGAGIESNRLFTSYTEKLARLINCRPDEIIFTSGGTESNNLALIGALKPFAHRGGKILTTPYEHPSVLETLHFVKTIGNFTLIEAPVSEWKNYINDDLLLASCSHVNHETGDINDIEHMATLLKSIHSKIIFHVDGAQGFCKEEIKLNHVDLYSFSAHKFYGPHGVGGLIVKRGTRLVPLFYGGGQQNALRPGTVNVQGIIQTVEAAEQMYINMKEHRKNVTAVKDILSQTAGVINCGEGNVSPYILNMSFLGIKGETLVHMLSEHGLYASMGAACRSHKKNASPLEKMGYSKDRAESAVRFSFSYLNTIEEAYAAKKILTECVSKLRDIFDK